MRHQLLFVTGQGKTGTSSLVGMLNTHPEVFVTYEANLFARPFSRRAAEFLAAYPSLQETLHSVAGIPEVYGVLAEYLAGLGYSYQFIGDKILTTTPGHASAEALNQHRVIFAVRDLRTWLCKNVVISHFMKESGIVANACSYIDQYLASFLLPHCLRVTMEELVGQNTEVLALLSGFLQLDLRKHARGWWKKIGHWPSSDPKAVVKWWNGHDSSMLEPRKLDTEAVLKDHPFWSEALPIFDRYYEGRLEQFPPAQIDRDRAALAELRRHHATLEDLYSRSRSVSFGSGWFGAWGHRSKNPHVKPHETN